MSRRLAPALCLLLFACSDDGTTAGAGGGDEGTSFDPVETTVTTDATVSASSTNGNTSTATTAQPGTGEPDDDGGYEGDGGSETGCAFTCPTPPGGGVFGCGLFADNCARGEKCAAWANDGGPIPNATRCAPAEPDPHLIGETCMWEGSRVSGIDTCAPGSHCWGPENDLNEGVCRPVCGWDPEQPVCPDGTSCVSIGNLPLCLDACDPIADAPCPAQESCLPAAGGFACSPVADGGQNGGPCQSSIQCAPGAVCLPAEDLPSCLGVDSCCAQLCNTAVPNECDGFLSCVPFPNAPPIEAYDDVGICQP